MDNRVQSLFFTASNLKLLEISWSDISDKPWSLGHPVFLLDRCWLRLEKVRFDELAKRLPPDKSGEAPELIRYNQLIDEGKDHLLAIQECWSEFGIEDFHRAIRNYWHSQDTSNQGWTFQIYLELFDQYRKLYNKKDFSMPIIILGRQKSKEQHTLEWISLEKSPFRIQVSSFIVDK